jgi:hypothetical protein
VILFKNIRYKIGLSILRRKSKDRRRKRALFNFENADSIGVVFKTNCHADFECVKKFLHYLSEKNSKIITICFVDNKKIEDFYLLRKGYNIFTLKDLNFFFIPDNSIVIEFIEKPFDILIDLSVDNNIPLHYISCLSKSKFRIGKLLSERNCMDLMIDTENNNTIENLVENIKYYMSVICNN